MMNVMVIDGHKAIISHDPDIGMFRGEFAGLNGGADFYAIDIDGLRREGEISLRMFLDECRRRGIEARRNYSGRFVLRTSPRAHEAASIAAAAHGVSLNQ